MRSNLRLGLHRSAARFPEIQRGKIEIGIPLFILHDFRKLLTVQTIKENTYARFKFYGRNNLGEKLGDCCEEIWHVSRKENVS